MFRTIMIGAVFALLAILPAKAADFEKGLAAYDGGDYAAALREWRPLVAKGNAEAQYSLGIMYFYGEGVTQSYPKAMKWWHEAAAQGYGEAQFSIGAAYAQGFGVSRNDALAFKWLSLSAANGNVNAIGLRNFIANRLPKNQLAAAQKPAPKVTAKQGNN